MSDILRLMDEARRLLEEEGHEQLAKEIKEALNAPEIHIKTPKGDLVAGVSKNEATQAYVCLEDNDNIIDLFLAEVPDKDLLEVYKDSEGLEEGDIRMLLWEDVHTEDYTHKSVIKAADLDQLREELGINNVSSYPTYDEPDEDSIDEICGLIEELRPGENTFVDVWSQEYESYLNIEAIRNGNTDTYDIITSLQDENGKCSVINEDVEVDISELYGMLLETVMIKEQEQELEY